MATTSAAPEKAASATTGPGSELNSSVGTRRRSTAPGSAPLRAAMSTAKRATNGTAFGRPSSTGYWLAYLPP